MPPERVIVPSLEAVKPVPAVGLPLASSGGHAVAHAPVHALLAPTSALNRYRVRPVESTRIDPRPLFATPTVAEAPLEVFGVAAVAAFHRRRTPRWPARQLVSPPHRRGK